MTTFARHSIVLLIFIGLWQMGVAIFHIPNFILPSPPAVFYAFKMDYPLIARHAIPTLIETFLGLSLGLILGSLVALLLAILPSIARWLLPLLIISQVIPTFAIAPILVIWLGYGLQSKIAVALLMVFFPIASAFYDGLRHTPRPYLDLAKTLQAKTLATFLYIRIPAALPSLASGLRIATVAAPMGAIVGEWVGSSQGLGYLMLYANERLQIDMMFAVLIVIIVLALSLYYVVDKLLNYYIWW